MATQKFIRESRYTSTDWHDMATVESQLQSDGSYVISDTDTIIATEIYNYIRDMVSKDITIDTIKDIMNGDQDVTIDTIVPTRKEEDGVIIIMPNNIEIFAKSKSGLGYQPHYDEVDFTNVVQYHIDEIEEENVAYLVSEHIVNPGKGSDLIERVYHEPFLSLDEAMAYQHKQMENYEHSDCTYHVESGFKISVVDKDSILHDRWYKDNMLALNYIKLLGLDAADYRFYRSAHGVVVTLQEQFYEAATPAEKLNIDKDIYSRIREYLSDKHKHDINRMLQACESKSATSTSREIVDRALILAHVDASSQADYDAIHDSLGEYDCRLTQLTRNKGRKQHGFGQVCITKDGDVGYFKNAFGISSWEGAKDNPYFGTMFYDRGGVIDILQSYTYHDKFVDTLPSQDMVDEYEAQYEEWEHQKAENAPFL